MIMRRGPKREAVPRKRRISAARAVATVGILAAVTECAKLALAALPNVEVVTLLVALWGYVFGWVGVCATAVFVCVEPLIWGVNTWVITYFLYWPPLSVLFMILSRCRVRNRVALTAAAVVMTFWFGVLSSLVDVGLLTGYFDNFLYRFGIYYARGVPFYAVQIACNAVLFPLCFLPLEKRARRLSGIGG